MAGIYIHIPFCNSFCSYCNFYSVKSKRYREQFVLAIKQEILSKKEYFKKLGVSPNTIYFGGGTPSVLSGDSIKEILDFVTNEFCVNSIETSIEVNPNDITEGFAAQLRGIGFNRVSMGVQSFIDDHLQWMNRRHTSKEAVQAFKHLREAGFNNISIDLIFGFSSLSMQQWEYNIAKAVELSPNHISSYQLSIEPGSALWREHLKNRYLPLDDTQCAKQYQMLQEQLASAGYEQYEISNFALRSSKGELDKSIHNSSYWSKEPYLGLGPAAHSYNGYQRFWNTSSIVKYCKHYLGHCADINVLDIETLTDEDKFNESVMLGLRTCKGINLNDLDAKYLSNIQQYIKMHLHRGNLVLDGDTIKIPSDRLFVSDGIIKDLFV